MFFLIYLSLLVKIIEFVEQSKSWSSVEPSSDTAENVMMGVSQEELYNLPTAEYIHRRGGFLARQLTVYHVAFHACADLKNVEVISAICNCFLVYCKRYNIYLFALISSVCCYLVLSNSCFLLKFLDLRTWMPLLRGVGHFVFRNEVFFFFNYEFSSIIFISSQLRLEKVL